MAKKHIPMRKCVVCGKSYPKRELVRIVRTPEGKVEVDPLGKKPGRGAYLCHNPTCWDLQVAIPKLQRDLRASLDEDARRALEAFAEEHIKAGNPATAGKPL